MSSGCLEIPAEPVTHQTGAGEKGSMVAHPQCGLRFASFTPLLCPQPHLRFVCKCLLVSTAGHKKFQSEHKLGQRNVWCGRFVQGSRLTIQRHRRTSVSLFSWVFVLLDTYNAPLVLHFLGNDAVWYRHSFLITNMKALTYGYHIILQKEQRPYLLRELRAMGTRTLRA